MLTTRPRGTNDITPETIARWHHIEERVRQICREFNYQEIRTPVFEHTELFVRGVGDTTDIVEKEMYTFQDRGGRSLTLRPEGTAAVVRAHLQGKLPLPAKYYYLGPVFRYERPQAGRFRQHTQFGVEVFGTQHPAVDAEIIALAVEFFRRFDLVDLEVNVNSLGCPVCRPKYRKKLLDYLTAAGGCFCQDCRNRIERNPLRILDCKQPECREVASGAPAVLDVLCAECHDHFAELQRYLTRLGIKYRVNPRIVRGIDYYTKTVFEIISQDLGAQDTVCGGGRYDGLFAAFGGPPTPATGFGMGLERLLAVLEKSDYQFPKPPRLDVFVAPMGPQAMAVAVQLLQELRQAGLRCDMDYLGRSLRAQMRQADKLDSHFAVLLGEQELEQGVAAVRAMDGGQQVAVPLTDIKAYLLAKQNQLDLP
ncbi:MAG TPA: histidine--tRNA ligase [Firmicutes bacterium]|nr:histidine--tRNA ligase [Bacillota bacterium]